MGPSRSPRSHTEPTEPHGGASRDIRAAWSKFELHGANSSCMEQIRGHTKPHEAHTRPIRGSTRAVRGQFEATLRFTLRL